MDVFLVRNDFCVFLEEYSIGQINKFCEFLTVSSSGRSLEYKGDDFEQLFHK